MTPHAQIIGIRQHRMERLRKRRHRTANRGWIGVPGWWRQVRAIGERRFLCVVASTAAASAQSKQQRNQAEPLEWTRSVIIISNKIVVNHDHSLLGLYRVGV
jgi:hypothetical protein